MNPCSVSYILQPQLLSSLLKITHRKCVDTEQIATQTPPSTNITSSTITCDSRTVQYPPTDAHNVFDAAPPTLQRSLMFLSCYILCHLKTQICLFEIIFNEWSTTCPNHVEGHLCILGQSNH